MMTLSMYWRKKWSGVASRDSTALGHLVIQEGPVEEVMSRSSQQYRRSQGAVIRNPVDGFFCRVV